MNLTISAWISWIILVLSTFSMSMILFLFFYSGEYDKYEKEKTKISKLLMRSIVTTIIVAVLSMILFSWFYTCTAAGKRARKTQDSNLRDCNINWADGSL